MELSTRAMVAERHPTLWDPHNLVIPVMRRYEIPNGERLRVWQLIENAIEMGYFEDIDYTVGCEQAFSLFLSENVPLHVPLRNRDLLVGVIDRLDWHGDDVTIHDLKTGKHIPSERELANSWQVRCYNIAARSFPLESEPRLGGVKFKFWYLASARAVEVEKSAEDAEEDRIELLSLADRIIRCDDPQPNPSGLCPYCLYEEQCPARKSK